MGPDTWFNLYHKEVSARIIYALGIYRDGTERQQIKDLLRNLIHRIDAVREGQTIRGMIYYYSPARAFEVCPTEMASQHGDELRSLIRNTYQRFERNV